MSIERLSFYLLVVSSRFAPASFAIHGKLESYARYQWATHVGFCMISASAFVLAYCADLLDVEFVAYITCPPPVWPWLMHAVRENWQASQHLCLQHCLACLVCYKLTAICPRRPFASLIGIIRTLNSLISIIRHMHTRCAYQCTSNKGILQFTLGNQSIASSFQCSFLAW